MIEVTLSVSGASSMIVSLPVMKASTSFWRPAFRSSGVQWEYTELARRETPKRKLTNRIVVRWPANMLRHQEERKVAGVELWCWKKLLMIISSTKPPNDVRDTPSDLKILPAIVFVLVGTTPEEGSAASVVRPTRLKARGLAALKAHQDLGFPRDTDVQPPPKQEQRRNSD